MAVGKLAAKAAANKFRVLLATTYVRVLHGAVICVLTALTGPMAHAQGVPPLQPGDRIRVVSQAVPQGTVEGRLVNLFRDTLSMVASDSIGFLAIHLNAIGQFEVSRGKSMTPMVGGVVLGAGVGAFLGSVLPASNDRCRAGFSDVEDCETEVPDAVIGALGGAIGAGILIRTLTPERWERIRPDLLLGVDIRPHAMMHVALSLSVRF